MTAEASRGSGARDVTAPGPAFPCAVCGRPLRRTARPGASRGARQIVCPRCRYRIYDYPRPCAGMAVVKGDALLVLRRGHTPKRGFLDLPGGFVEVGEAIEASARRELEEETGLTVGRVEWLGLYWDRYYLQGFGFFPSMNFYWLARWRSGEPRAADDAAHAEWVPLARLRRPGPRFAWRHMRDVFRDVAGRVTR